jgi:hypothetical protein
VLTPPICGVSTTMVSEGQPPSSVVWVDVDGGEARVNMTLERQTGRLPGGTGHIRGRCWTISGPAESG